MTSARCMKTHMQTQFLKMYLFETKDLIVTWCYACVGVFLAATDVLRLVVFGTQQCAAVKHPIPYPLKMCVNKSMWR